MVWGAVAGAIGNAVIGRRDNYFNKSEADRARDWSKGMSNTEIQRRVADMKAAGINPMLAVGAGGGASTPGSASASAGSSPSISEGLQVASAMALQKAQKQKVDAETDYINQNSAKVAAETKALEAVLPYSAKNAETSSNKLFREMELLGVEVDKRISEADKSMTEAEMSRELAPLIKKFHELQNLGMEFDISEKRANAAFFDKIGEGSKWMQLIRELMIGIRSMR